MIDMEKFCALQRISEAELADFMGISVRHLQRLDQNGMLPAIRSRTGRRVYTTEHLRRALEIMENSASREVKASFHKNGAHSMCGRVDIPRRWLEHIGITSDDPTAQIRYDGEKIIISKKET